MTGRMGSQSARKLASLSDSTRRPRHDRFENPVALRVVATLEAVNVGWRATKVLVCLCALVTTLPLPHVAVVVQRRLWNLDLGSRSSRHLRTGTEGINGNSWVQVAMCGTTSGKLKGVHTKQQCNGAQTVYSLDAYANGDKFSVYETVCALFPAVSNALPVFGCFRSLCIVATSRIPLDRI